MSEYCFAVPGTSYSVDIRNPWSDVYFVTGPRLTTDQLRDEINVSGFRNIFSALQMESSGFRVTSHTNIHN